jgi:hypothetical protein
VNYKLIMNELWMDYEGIDGNPCKWIPFIMWSCLMLMFVTYDCQNVFLESLFHYVFSIWKCNQGLIR